MTENLSSLTISPFIHDSPNRRPVRSAVHNPPMMGKRIIFIFILFSEVEEEDGGRDDQHEKEGRRRVENIAASKKKKREKGGWKWRHRCVAFVVVTGPSVLSLSSRPATRFLRRTNLSSSSSFASGAAQDGKN